MGGVGYREADSAIGNHYVRAGAQDERAALRVLKREGMTGAVITLRCERVPRAHDGICRGLVGAFRHVHGQDHVQVVNAQLIVGVENLALLGPEPNGVVRRNSAGIDHVGPLIDL